MTEYGITDRGFVSKPYDQIIADYAVRARNQFGDTFTLAQYTLIYELLESIAREHEQLWLHSEDLYYSGYVEYATGNSLDGVVAVLGLGRKAATAATGAVTISRSASGDSITIPAGTRVATSDSSRIYQTDATVYLTGTEVAANITAVDAGADGNVPAETIVLLLDNLPGGLSVANAGPTGGGTDAEDDPTLRYRAILYQPGAKATKQAIENTLLAVSDVRDVSLLEDFTDHTITATVLGGSDEDITDALEDVRPAGIFASWGRPTYVGIDISVTVLKESSASPEKVEDAVDAALDEYLAALSIGDDVTYSDLARAILAADGVDDINSLSATDGTTTITAFGDSVVIAAGSKATNGSYTISVS